MKYYGVTNQDERFLGHWKAESSEDALSKAKDECRHFEDGATAVLVESDKAFKVNAIAMTEMINLVQSMFPLLRFKSDEDMARWRRKINTTIKDAWGDGAS